MADVIDLSLQELASATSEQPPKCEIEIQESGEALSYKLASVEEFRNLPENAAW